LKIYRNKLILFEALFTYAQDFALSWPRLDQLGREPVPAGGCADWVAIGRWRSSDVRRRRRGHRCRSDGGRRRLDVLDVEDIATLLYADLGGSVVRHKTRG